MKRADLFQSSALSLPFLVRSLHDLSPEEGKEKERTEEGRVGEDMLKSANAMEGHSSRKRVGVN